MKNTKIFFRGFRILRVFVVDLLFNHENTKIMKNTKEEIESDSVPSRV